MVVNARESGRRVRGFTRAFSTTVQGMTVCSVLESYCSMSHEISQAHDNDGERDGTIWMTFGPVVTLAAFDKLACDEVSLFGGNVVY